MLSQVSRNTSSLLTGADAFHAEISCNVLASIFHLDRKPDAQVLAASFEAVAGRFPLLAYRLVREPRPRLERVSVFAPSKAIEFRSVADNDELLAAASCIYTAPLPTELPPWRIVILSSDKPAPAWLGVVCFHHCIMDGIGIRDLAKALSTAAGPSIRRHGSVHNERARLDSPMRTSTRMASSVVRELKNTRRRAVGLVHGASSDERVFAMLDLPRTPLRLACPAAGVGIVPLLLVLMGEALARYTGTSAARPLRMMVPHAVEHRGPYRAVGNQYAPIIVDVPLGGGSTVADRIRSVYLDRQSALAGAPLQLTTVQMKLLAQLPRALRRFFYRRWAESVDLICSILPSDGEGIHLGGAQVTRHYGFAPLPEGHGVSVTVLCAPKHLRVGLLMDPAIIAMPAELVEALQTVYTEWISTARP